MATKTKTAAAAETAAVKDAPVKEAAPKAEKKAPAKKTVSKPIKSSLYVQFAGKEYTEKNLVTAAKKAYVALGNKAADIKKIDIYVKTEENVAYYTVNGAGSPDYKIDL